MIRAEAPARILIVGQAPGTLAHKTGLTWNDPSGDRLRDWMGVDRETFYDASRIAIMPMGFCYPGRNPRGGDLPPRKECAEHWHEPVRSRLPNVELTLLVGRHAQLYYLEDAPKTLTETVRSWRSYVPDYLPLPHPSWRNNAWIKANPWYSRKVLPYLRKRIAELT